MDDFFWQQNAEHLKRELQNFIHYFKSIANDQALQKKAERAAALLEAYPPKLDAHSFGKEDAIELNADLTKGIGEWGWPPAYAMEIDVRGDRIAALTGSFF